MSETVPCIEAHAMEVHYEDFQALKGLTCTIPSGTVGLLGPNGAGKSTFMKTILGYNRTTSGSLKVFGMEMPKAALAVRQRVGYMPEKEVVSPEITAVGFVTYLGRLFGMSRVDAMERTHEVLNFVGITESRYRKMETYSTGMLQRVKLAQALIHDPKLLLLDEPTNGLDPEGRDEMLELIEEVSNKREITVILSSHLLPDVQQVCKRILMVNHGQVVRDGTVEELTRRQANQFDISVRENIQSLIQTFDEKGFPWHAKDDGLLQVELPEDLEASWLYELARTHQTQIRHFEPARMSLASVFIDAIGRTPHEVALES
ncbi:MAG: ABC transporter ATP-binding protein [Candidatus Hydrogenedentes bacterium]|nr:ABC transporter ATP-binding protein [Candidatus Hydrogenedentota bacterium]